MRSRLFHRPALHSPSRGHEKKPTWLELFYDLVFVAAFIQLGNGLSRHTDLAGYAGFAAVFAPMWVAWTGMTFYINRFTVDDFTHRIVVLLQMFAIGGMAIYADDVLDGDAMAFAIAYAIAQGVVAVLYLRTWQQVPDARDYSRYWGGVFGIGAALWAVSVAVPAPYTYGFWGVGIAWVLSAPFSKSSRALRDRYPIDEEHLTERYGLLTLIVLGESFVKVLSELTPEGGASLLLQASFTLLITVCLWWIYFDDVAGSRIKEGRGGVLIWFYAHLPLQIAVTATGVGIKKAATIFDLAEVAPAAYRWLLAGSLALALASVALIDSVTERRQAELSDRLRVNVRFGSAVMILLLAPAGAGMSSGMFLGLITAICVAQVAFDMMMAPLEAEPEGVEHTTIAELVKRRDAGEEVHRRVIRPRVGDAVRKGTPAELRRDIYYYFMEGGWFRYLMSLLFVYVMLNVFFAALYFLQPGCVANVRPDSFSDAFFFSVETLSTIGFGSMNPVTDYGHAVVTVEAAIGMLFVAIATGLTFAKVSRPRASVLFSKVMVIHERSGVPTLVFRVGNARGNEIVDASMSVTIVKDEITPEGDHLRRLHDLELARSRSPFFTLTWVVMHEIDEDSPLGDCPLDDIGAKVLAVLVTLVGHDGTYGQTVYARKQYDPEDILVGHHFVDVISSLEDGRLLIDYDKFHDTVAD